LDSFQLPVSGIPTSPPSSIAPENTNEQQSAQENMGAGEEKLDENKALAKSNPSSPLGALKPAAPTYAKVVESSIKPLTIDGTPLRILLAEDNSGNCFVYNCARTDSSLG
jgi:cytoskeletal protein RodZ